MLSRSWEAGGGWTRSRPPLHRRAVASGTEEGTVTLHGHLLGLPLLYRPKTLQLPRHTLSHLR